MLISVSTIVARVCVFKVSCKHAHIPVITIVQTFSLICLLQFFHIKTAMKTVNPVSIIEHLLSTYHTRPANGKQTHNTKLTSTNITIIPPMAVRDHRGTWINVLLQVVSTSLHSVIFLMIAAGSIH